MFTAVVPFPQPEAVTQTLLDKYSAVVVFCRQEVQVPTAPEQVEHGDEQATQLLLMAIDVLGQLE